MVHIYMNMYISFLYTCITTYAYSVHILKKCYSLHQIYCSLYDYDHTKVAYH